MTCAQKNYAFLRRTASRLSVLSLAVFVSNALAGETLPPATVDEPSSIGLIGGVLAAGLAVRWAVRRKRKNQGRKD
jgi:hypothetical protein